MTRFPALLIFLSVMAQSAEAQSNKPLSNGAVKGLVKDSSYNFMLTSATIAVYKDADSSLLQFTLPNSFGEFTIQQLPTDILLHLVITHVGYKSLFKKFTINNDAPIVDLGILFIHQQNDDDINNLQEIVIKAIAPMRMNGDTVEFNAAAFRMDSSATAEDLFRRLPGFTVWADGEITYNGKKINAVLVEGKPFLGSSDPTIATQNLPKNALDKIQVYQQRNEKNPLDSTLYANIKLKEDKKVGYFGKAGTGYGTGKHYASDGMLSGFNKKLQATVVGAFNNINKVAGSTDVLMKNSSFKGEGANSEYQSDFSMRGLNKPAAAGIKFQYDFIPEVEYQKSSRLNADYFIGHNNAFLNNQTVANTFLQADTLLIKNTQSFNTNISTIQNFSTQYAKSSEKFNLAVTAGINSINSLITGQSTGEQEKTKVGTIGNNNSSSETENWKRGFNMGVDYTNQSAQDDLGQIPGYFTLSYQFSTTENDGNGKTKSNYASSLNPSANREFDRYYEQNNSRNNSHSFKAGYPGLKQLIFNKHDLGGLQIGIAGFIRLDNKQDNDVVSDMNSQTQKYQRNNDLTYTTHATTKEFVPELIMSKSFAKALTNRYSKHLSISVRLKNQYFDMDHRSSLGYQNFSYTYSRFIPQASIHYTTHQYGSYETGYGLDFSTSVTYPGVNNIAPIVDSSNLWYIPKGNTQIKPQYKKELGLTYSFTTRTPKNPLRINLNVGVGQIDHNIADSSLYDTLGVRTVYAVNVNGNKFANGGVGLRKSYEARRKNTFEAEMKFNIYASNNPQYINSVLNISKSINHNTQLSLNYRCKDIVTLKFEKGISFYTSEQTGFNKSKFKSMNDYVRFSGTLQLPKNLVWGTNITQNKSTSNNSKAILFTIWNANLIYRFLKGKNGEIKFSALDLLRQNKGILNSSNGNTQTLTTSNVLQQYFMITISYYPRKFGK